MSAIYDNWERLVAAALKKQQLWELFHAQSRSPSILSDASDLSSSSFGDLVPDFVDISASTSSSRLVFVSDFTPTFNFNNVYLDSAELLGRGTFGTTYAAAMNDQVKIVVKRLKSADISEFLFKYQMDIIGKIRHENVVPLRSYYCFGRERLMLYDYYKNDSVSALLHGKTGKSKAPVDWATRLKVAIGAARGIAKIHEQGGNKFVHGNIKSSNIFINSKKFGCVSDFGLANMIETTFMSTSHCYAPELRSITLNVSQESDVYSFGIFLLELLTRKSPVDVPGGPVAVDLVKLVSSIKSRLRTSTVFDVDLLQYPDIREQMVKVLQIGISCVSKSPKKRPQMNDVVMMLGDLIRANPRDSIPSSQNLVFTDDGTLEFDLEDLLKASAEVLGKGMFGTSYKATLENGEIYTVKRLKGVTENFENFEQLINTFGRSSHRNIRKLRAYHYSRDEKLMVYDYHPDNLYDLLHGNSAGSKRSLDWETRLKIAVGAARGLNYIHRQDGFNFVHGNVKSSNVLVSSEQYVLVSDAGWYKLVPAMRRSTLRDSDHFPPEVRSTYNVSQSSDVYSFGVVLLELVCRRRAAVVSDDGESTTTLVGWALTSIRDDGVAKVIDSELDMSNEESIVQLLQLALSCVNVTPEKRPKMAEIVMRLEEIAEIESEDASTEDMEPVILEDILEILLHTIIRERE